MEAGEAAVVKAILLPILVAKAVKVVMPETLTEASVDMAPLVRVAQRLEETVALEVTPDWPVEAWAVMEVLAVKAEIWGSMAAQAELEDLPTAALVVTEG